MTRARSATDTTRWVIKSGGLVWRRHTFGSDGQFVDDPSLVQATLMPRTKAQGIIDTTLADILGSQSTMPPQYQQCWQERMDQWGRARVVRVCIRECDDQEESA